MKQDIVKFRTRAQFKAQLDSGKECTPVGAIKMFMSDFRNGKLDSDWSTSVNVDGRITFLYPRPAPIMDSQSIRARPKIQIATDFPYIFVSITPNLDKVASEIINPTSEIAPIGVDDMLAIGNPPNDMLIKAIAKGKTFGQYCVDLASLTVEKLADRYKIYRSQSASFMV
jgi:hypothetical protein